MLGKKLDGLWLNKSTFGKRLSLVKIVNSSKLLEKDKQFMNSLAQVRLIDSNETHLSFIKWGYEMWSL